MAFHKQAELLPRYQLPSWTRASLAGRQEQATVRQLPRDKPKNTPRMVLEKAVSLRDSRHMDQAQSGEVISQLERSLSFLRSQHSDTLQQLHTELERLKKENRELNFKLVMCRCGQKTSKARREKLLRMKSKVSSVDSDHSEMASGEDTLDELRPFLLEEEVRELKNSLQIERKRNSRLMKVIEQKITEQKSVDHGDEDDREHSSQYASGISVQAGKAAAGAHNPQLEECKLIIRELQLKNQQQGNELVQLKADLQDLLYSDKWTPDAYLIARGYVSSEALDKNDDKIELTTNEKLPEISKRKESKIKEQAYKRLHESIHLPALKLRQHNPVAERHRRTLSIQRGGGGRLTTTLHKDPLNYF